jgi:hypothetical protein
MKGRYIIVTIIILYLALIAVATVYAAKEEPETEHTPTPTPTATGPVSNCEQDKIDIQAALDAYYDDNTSWPTADGQSGDIIWDELVPEYMSNLPLIDNSCDWQVSSNLEGQVCVAHTC